MAWIKTVSLAEGGEALEAAVEAQHALYPPEYGPPAHPEDGELAGIVAAHSLLPDALRHAFATFGALLSPELPLSRAQHERIALAVSRANGTAYCSLAHAEFLRRAGGDEAPATRADAAIVDYAVKVTRDATQVGPDDHERLRAVGFDDTGILQITLIAAWFNYINRAADALGVGRG